MLLVLQIQFEIAHNAIHLWLGGSEKYSMSHLHYASYDPSFYLYHANTDRIFALWQALQKYRCVCVWVCVCVCVWVCVCGCVCVCVCVQPC